MICWYVRLASVLIVKKFFCSVCLNHFNECSNSRQSHLIASHSCETGNFFCSLARSVCMMWVPHLCPSKSLPFFSCPFLLIHVWRYARIQFHHNSSFRFLLTLKYYRNETIKFRDDERGNEEAKQKRQIKRCLALFPPAVRCINSKTIKMKYFDLTRCL